MKTNLTLLFLLLVSGIWAQPLQEWTLHFESGRHELTAESKSQLDEVALRVGQLQEFRLYLAAHTDAEGTGAFNQALSQRRAQSVRSYLQGKGVPTDGLVVETFGENQPAFTNDDEDGRARNRRVQLRLEGLRLESLDDLWGHLDRSAGQTYRIDPTVATRLVGTGGTTIWIDALSFVDEHGAAVDGGFVEIFLQEALDLEQMVVAGLSTTSGDRLLETSGMIEIRATADGRPLQLREGAELTVALPQAVQREDMELFFGRPGEAGQAMDWAPADQPAATDLEALLDLPPAPEQPFFSFLPPLFRADSSDFPVFPRRPETPRPPRQPEWENVHYNPGFFKKLTIGKDGVEERKQEMYAERMARYEERRQQYEQALIDLPNKMEAYDLAVADYHLAVAAWNDRREAEALEFQDGGAKFEQAFDWQRERYLKRKQLYQQRLEEWREVKRQRLAAYEQEFAAVGSVDARSLQNYFFKVSELGWINCDRFYNVPQEDRLPLVVRDADQADEKVYVIFQEMNSLIGMYKRPEGYRADGLPRGARVKLLGIKVEDGRAQMAVTEARVGREDPFQLDYRPCTLTELSLELERL